MSIPGKFLPSKYQKRLGYDEEGRLREFNLSRQSTGGIGDSNSLFSTEAEKFDVMAPFLKRAKAKDAPRRNYIVQPGGACIYFGDEPARAFQDEGDPWGGGKVQYTAPASPVSFGHASGPSSGIPQGQLPAHGVSFRVGPR